MTSPANEILASLRVLSLQDRAEIAAALLHSLDQGDQTYEVEWDIELARRRAEIISGKEKGIPAKEVFASLFRKYS